MGTFALLITAELTKAYLSDQSSWLFRGERLRNTSRQYQAGRWVGKAGKDVFIPGRFGVMQSLKPPPTIGDPKVTGYNYTVEYLLNPILLWKFVVVCFEDLQTSLSPMPAILTGQRSFDLLQSLARPSLRDLAEVGYHPSFKAQQLR